KVEVRNADTKKGLSYKEKIELEKLVVEIQEIEGNKKKIQELLVSGETNHEKLINWGKELETLEQQLEEKTNRWLALSELE
ncbi:MAG: ABC transporter C-terminal domain-containing protein, partial [Chryseotalea sp.]